MKALRNARMSLHNCFEFETRSDKSKRPSKEVVEERVECLVQGGEGGG